MLNRRKTSKTVSTLQRQSTRFIDAKQVQKITTTSQQIKQDELGNATNMIRPFKQLYHQLKWLNQFAITNEMVVQKLLDEMGQKMFISSNHQLIIKNLDNMLANTQFKQHAMIPNIFDDIIEVYARLFTDNNKRKALKQLDDIAVISKNNIITISGLVAASLSFISVIIYNLIIHEEISVSYFF